MTRTEKVFDFRDAPPTHQLSVKFTVSFTGDSEEMLKYCESDWDNILDALLVNWLKEDLNISNKKKF